MKLRVGVALLFLLTCSVAAFGQRSVGEPLTAKQIENQRRQVTKMLSEQKIPKVELDNATMREAVDFWVSGTGKGWNLVVKLGDEGEPASGSERRSLITIRRKEMSSREFLDEICRQGGLKWSIDLSKNWGCITIIPKPK